MPGKIPNFIYCVLCKGVIKDAVTVRCCGYSGCEACIKAAILSDEVDRRCPFCQEYDQDPSTAVKNLNIRQLASYWKNQETEWMYWDTVGESARRKAEEEKKNQPTVSTKKPAKRKKSQTTSSLTKRQK